MQDDRGSLRGTELPESRHQGCEPDRGDSRPVSLRLKLRLPVLSPQILRRQAESGAIQPGHRVADLVGPLQGSGEGLGHGVVDHGAAACGEGVDRPPQARGSVPEQLLVVDCLTWR
jgi:hypothetical protein